MKKEDLNISPRYIVDSTGKKTEVVLDISTFEKMLESLEDMYFGLQAEQALDTGEFIDFDEINKRFSLSK
ncbi:MAG TPA: hypothetical protein VJ201_05340 [Candidatus Babeliales bacterium]|nr:hypothetical protein [Candidatus Babeliales bacterium]